MSVDYQRPLSPYKHILQTTQRVGRINNTNKVKSLLSKKKSKNAFY